MSQTPKAKPTKPRCGLCGKTTKLVKTDCCGQWICDDGGSYVLFSYARNSCSRNHDRYTLCSFHHQNGHKGHWKDCKLCRKSFGTEIYVWFGTNEHNFETLENPPAFAPTLCDGCGVRINLGTDGYSIGPKGTLCECCGDLERGYGLSPKARKPSAPRPPKVQLPVNSNPGAIEIILSAKVQQRWRVKPVVRANETPAHWLALWRVDFAQKADRTWVALMTNVATLFTFVFPLRELKPDRFEQLFRLRLGFALTDAPTLAAWKDAPFVYATGNPRVTVGSMNGMKLELPWNTGSEEFKAVDDEDWINDGVFLSLPETSPRNTFNRRLAEAVTRK